MVGRQGADKWAGMTAGGPDSEVEQVGRKLALIHTV
jgi:hypothetical protein